MIDRGFDKEVDHLTRAMQFINCAEAFEKMQGGESISNRQHVLMVKFSTFLLYAWAYHHNNGCNILKRYTAIPIDQAMQAWSDVNGMYGKRLVVMADLKPYREYWAFINQMRRVALAIGFQRQPRCSADDVEPMIRWCERIGNNELARAHAQRGCYG